MSDIPKIEMSISSTPIHSNPKKLDAKWTIAQSGWMLFIDGVSEVGSAEWYNINTKEVIPLDYETVMRSLSDTPEGREAAETIRNLLPNDD